MLEAGSLVAGKLRIERVLGQGGMGTVCVATHVGLDQRVAIKVLLPELANQPEVVARFVREARASAKLKSEHVCRVTDVGQLETGEPYIEMELLEGQDLSKLIEQAPLSIETAAEYVLQACIAVAEAHHAGIIHRDLKPANLFVTHRMDGTALIKVLDFGIATAPTQAELKITKTTTVMGSPGYMSPEHLRSARDVDARSDIWALGVILYEAVTGRLPFVANTITELAVKVVMDEPEPIGAIEPRFAGVIAKCLAKPAAERYQTVAELAADLAPFGGASATQSAMLVAKILTGSAQMPAASGTAALNAASARLAAAAPPTNIGHGATMAAPAAQASNTTLAGATGSSTMPPAKKRNPALVAGLVILVLGGGAVGAVLATRSTDKPAVAPKLDANVVAQVTPDAAPAPPVVDAAEPNMQIAKLVSQFAEQKDWSAIITITDGSTDAALAPAIESAKKNYVAEEIEDIVAYAKRGECATAKATATSAKKIVPDHATELDKAATCAPKPKPPTPTIDLANAAYDNADYAKALALVEQVLAKNPKDPDALALAARAACGAANAEKARAYIVKLPAPDRKLPLSVCRMNKVDLGPAVPAPVPLPPKPPTPTPTPVPHPLPPPPLPPKPPEKLDVPKEIEFMRSAMLSQNYPNALSSAQKILAVDPTEREATRIAGIASCHTHQYDIAKSILAMNPPRAMAAAIRRACGKALDP